MNPREFWDFMMEFRKMVGDRGIRKNSALEEKLYPNIIKLSKELNSRQKALGNDTKVNKTADDIKLKLSPGKKLDKKTIAKLYSMEEDSDNVPEEPMNHVVHAQRAEIVDKYSLDNKTGTLPADRVKIAEEDRKPLFKKKRKPQDDYRSQNKS